MRRPELVAGWDIGGAHVKLSLIAQREPPGGATPRGPVVKDEAGATELVLVDAAQWACPLWQGLDRLHEVLADARSRWPQLARARHAVTMTGEMVDLFEHREAGVLALAELLGTTLGGELAFWAGDGSWCRADELGARWAEVASANWAATAAFAAARVADAAAMLVDIGSTTTDLIALRGGAVCAQGRSDADRLASGELLYQGVVRTPLCALAPRITHRGRLVNVMNEWFATTADVHRLLGDLDPTHDQQPAADGGAKDAAATRRRLARMIGLDARDAADDEWRALADAWRETQLEALAQNFERVAAAARLPREAGIVAAGCGDFLAIELARRLQRPCLRFDALVIDAADASPEAAAKRRAVQLAAPAVAVALLQAHVPSAAARLDTAANDGTRKAGRCGS